MVPDSKKSESLEDHAPRVVRAAQSKVEALQTDLKAAEDELKKAEKLLRAYEG